ncbi:MAG TPA: YjcG family protein [Virgibacillus sp.]|nr:YjcG family protein [Virgibacillus sp.]
MKYGVAIFPSRDIQDDANSYRKRYDPKYALIPPHITLKSAFTADDETIDDLIVELKHIANDTKPFTININKFSTFAPVTNTIYFKVEPIPELTELHEKMHQGKFSSHNEHPFVPHITVAQDLVPDEYSDVLGTLQMTHVKHEDYVDRFHLLYELGNGSWAVHETFVFGKEHV